MPWFKVDDSFHAHPKVLATDPDALGLWVVAGSWSSAHLLDGFVPDHVLPRLLPDSATLAKKLVTAGLWRKVRGGYQFHDFSDYNPASDDVRTMREKRAAAGRMGGLASGKTRSKQASKTEALASPIVEPPARPDPAPKGGTPGDPLTPRAREAPPPRCPDHLDDPDPPPCGRCADARRRREHWDREQAAADAAAAHHLAVDRAATARAAIDACTACDRDGRLPGGVLCHHDPGNAVRTRRGAAAARAQLRQPREQP